MIGKYKIVAVCTSRLGDSSTHEFVSSLNTFLAPEGYRLFVYNTCSDLTRSDPMELGEATVFRLIDYDVVDTVLICDENLKNKDIVRSIIENAEKRDIPVVTTDRRYGSHACAVFDYEMGFEKAVRHVTDHHGKRDIHFIAGLKDNSFSESRIEVFKRVIEEKGIAFDREKMVSYGDFWSHPAMDAARRLIDEDRVPEAVICANDSMAIAVESVFIANGIRVPEDVIITGFDGIEEIYFTKPELTSCRCSFRDLAKAAAELIISGEQKQIDVIPEMLINNSCGCHNDVSVDASEYMRGVTNSFYRYREEERTLNEMIAKMQVSENLSDAASFVPTNVIYDMCCLLVKECIDDRIDPLVTSADHLFGDKLCLFINTDAEGDFRPQTDFDIKNIIPDLHNILDRKMPLLFTALSYQSDPLGYVCFHFSNCDIEHYCKISQTVTALNTAVISFRNLRYQHYLNKRIENMSRMDIMTGLYNRNSCILYFEDMLRQCSSDMTFLLADLDGLKHINDNFGHAEGDNAIITAASAFKASCPSGAVCARIGGDEMIAFFTDSCPIDSVKQSINERLERYNARSGKPYAVSLSVGGYIVNSGSSTNFEDMLRRADKLMYEEKIKKRIARK